MNEFQRKYLDILKQTDYISAVARPGREIVSIDYYAYTATIGTPAAPVAIGGTRQALVQIQADSDFVMTAIAGGSQPLIANAITYTAPVLFQLTDTGSGKRYFSAPTPMASVAGSGAFPFVLPSPRVLQPNTILQIDVINVGAATIDQISFAFHGARIFYAG